MLAVAGGGNFGTAGRVVKSQIPPNANKQRLVQERDARQLTFDHDNTPLDPEIIEILALRK